MRRRRGRHPGPRSTPLVGLRRVQAATGGVAAVLLLAACGTTSATTQAPPATTQTSRPGAGTVSPTPAGITGTARNDADVMFLQMMVTHHGQGLQMVKLAEEKATRAEIKTLAAAIDVTQTDEVKTMTGWLRSWRQPTEADPNANVHAHHGGMPATGPAQIEALRQAGGTDFDRKFLNLFIAHQHNAAEMARTETETGTNSEAKELARRIQESRAAEVKQMLTMLG